MAKITKKLIEAQPSEAKPYFVWDAGDGALKGFGFVVNPTGRKNFVAQFRIGTGRGSKTKRVTIGAFPAWTVEQARERARALIREGGDGIDRQALDAEKDRQAAAQAAADELARRQARDLQLRRVAARYMREHVRLKRKPNTIEFYRHVIAAHILPALGKMDIRQISRQDVARLHARLASKPAMANRVIAVLGAIYGWAEAIDLCPEGLRRPTYKVEKYRENVKERFLSIEELQRLGDAIRRAETIGIPWEPNAEGKTKHAPRPENRFVRIDGEAAAALRLLIFTGARLREILRLEWKFIDLDRGLLRLPDSKTGPKTIILNSAARAVLVGMKARGPFVFPGESLDGKPQPRTDLKRPWRLVKTAAGLEDVRIHDLRHSFASVGAADGLGLVIVGKLLGHKQASTTERYAHLDNDPLRKASDAIAGKIAAAMGEERPAPEAEVIPFRQGA